MFVEEVFIGFGQNLIKIFIAVRIPDSLLLIGGHCDKWGGEIILLGTDSKK